MIVPAAVRIHAARSNGMSAFKAQDSAIAITDEEPVSAIRRATDTTGIGLFMCAKELTAGRPEGHYATTRRRNRKARTICAEGHATAIVFQSTLYPRWRRQESHRLITLLKRDQGGMKVRLAFRLRRDHNPVVGRYIDMADTELVPLCLRLVPV